MSWLDIIFADEMSTYELAAALEAGADDEPWGRRAALVLASAHRSWLDRWEFRQAVEVGVNGDGQLCAFVDWDAIDTGTTESWADLSLLEVARYLAGASGARPLSDLLSDLDDFDLCRVMAALNVAARGKQESLR